MAYNFLPYDPDQLFLLPPSLSEWVGEGSLARFVSDVVEELDAEDRLAAFYTGYRADGWGHPGYHPRMLVKVRAEWSLWCTTHNLLKLWRAHRAVARALYATV